MYLQIKIFTYNRCSWKCVIDVTLNILISGGFTLERGDMVMKVKTLNKFLLVIIILYQLVMLVDKVKDVVQVVIQG